jgi:hypothetical protein
VLCSALSGLDLLETRQPRALPWAFLFCAFSAQIPNERGMTNAQLDFVSFLDGDEKKGHAKFQDEKVFIETLQRPALTWLQ